jgi:hypothetical protein
VGTSSGGVRGRNRMEDIGLSSKRGVGCVVDVDGAMGQWAGNGVFSDVVIVEDDDELPLALAFPCA